MSQTKDIRAAVEGELSYDPLIDDSDISVKNINGDVALNGTVPSYPQYVEAAAAARRVAGVKNLQNHLEVVLPTADYRDDATLTTTRAVRPVPEGRLNVPRTIWSALRGSTPSRTASSMVSSNLAGASSFTRATASAGA